MDFDALLALASARRWDEMKVALNRPENRVLCPEGVVRFEELGDQCVASGSLLDAIEYFYAALHCTMILLFAPAKGEDANWLVAPYTRLCQKGPDARRRFDDESKADISGPVEWTSGTERIVALGLMGRLQEADSLLARLDRKKDRSSENFATCGRKLEAASDQSLALQPQMAIWFLDGAVRRFELAKRLAKGGEADAACATDLDRAQRKLDVLRPPPPKKVKIQPPDPQVVLEALLQKLQRMASARHTSSWMNLLREKTAQAFYPQIAKRFEALGDEQREKGQSSVACEFYRVASDALDLIPRRLINSSEKHRSERVAGNLWKLEQSVLEERIAHPVGSDFVPGRPGGSHVMDSVELLVLARRFQEADRLLSKVERLGKYGPVYLNRLERTGDLLEQKHPELARWFFEKFRQYAADLPHDREYETRECEAVVGSAEEKLNRVKARLPKPRATIRISLADWGDPTGSCPDPQITSQTVDEEGLLTLAPDWVFADYREEGGRVLRPEQWPARYRYRVYVVGKRAYLHQIEDEYGRRQPFDLGSNAPVPDVYRAPPVPLNVGEPVTIYCRVSGGGPEWTLTLSGLDEVPPNRA